MFIAGSLHFVGGLLFIKYVHRPAVLTHRTELHGMRLVLLPLLQAERDRAYVKSVHRIRDAEEDLMKDVPGWETGTWWGEPVYKTIPDGE